MAYDSALVGSIMTPAITVLAIGWLRVFANLGAIGRPLAKRGEFLIWTAAVFMQGLFSGAALNAPRIFFH